MASMDHLRDKIRARKSETGDLQSPTAAPVFDNQTGELHEPGGQTDSLISEIFTPESHTAQFSQSAPKTSTKASKPPKQPSKLNLPFMNRFQHLEVNRKMLMISLGIAALASFLSMAYLKGIAEPLRSKSRLIKVVALTQDVPARTQLTEKMLTIKEIPADYLPDGTLEYKPNLELLGQVTLTSLYKGEILHSKRISLPTTDTGITTVIPDAHRAITIRTDNASLIQPSTSERKEYVDVLATIPDPNPVRRGKLITIPLLQRVMVLAVGDHLTPGDQQASAAPSNHITLAVPEDRVSVMVTLGEKGNFKVIPRAPEDTSTIREKYTIQEIEDALQGRFEATPESTPEPAKTVKEDPPEPEAPAPAAPLVDYSNRSTPAYTAPRRSTPVYRAPARTPVRRAPVSRPAAKAAKPAPAAPAASTRRRAQAPAKAPVIINGGVVTQGGR